MQQLLAFRSKQFPRFPLFFVFWRHFPQYLLQPSSFQALIRHHLCIVAVGFIVTRFRRRTLFVSFIFWMFSHLVRFGLLFLLLFVLFFFDLFAATTKHTQKRLTKNTRTYAYHVKAECAFVASRRAISLSSSGRMVLRIEAWLRARMLHAKKRKATRNATARQLTLMHCIDVLSQLFRNITCTKAEAASADAVAKSVADINRFRSACTAATSNPFVICIFWTHLRRNSRLIRNVEIDGRSNTTHQKYLRYRKWTQHLDPSSPIVYYLHMIHNKYTTRNGYSNDVLYQRRVHVDVCRACKLAITVLLLVSKEATNRNSCRHLGQYYGKFYYRTRNFSPLVRTKKALKGTQFNPEIQQERA